MNQLTRSLTAAYCLAALGLSAVLGTAGCPANNPGGGEAASVESGQHGTGGSAIRAVSLVPSVSELVYAIGAQTALVGRSTYCNYPPDVVSLPAAGTALTPDMETLIALSTTHVLAPVDQQTAPWVQSLAGLQITYVAVPDRRLDDVPVAMNLLGEVLEVREQAAAASAAFSGRLQGLRERMPAGPGVPTLIVVGMDPLFVAGGDSRMNELLELAGGTNVVEQGDWVQLEAESLLAADPALIVTLGPADVDQWTRRFPRVRAVAQGSLCAVDADRISRPGPRILDSVDELAACVRMVTMPAPAGRADSE
jgi:ABC-type hemin transport system substrate-binding protein